MKKIPTSLHAMMDYTSAAILIAAPWIFKFNDVGTATWLCVIAGLMIVLLSLFTRYEGGLVRVLPMPIHLLTDVVLGVFLILSPWIFGFAQYTYLFHLAMGLTALLSGLWTVPYVRSDAMTVQTQYNKN